MNKNYTLFPVIFVVIILMLCSCGSVKDIAYLQQVDSENPYEKIVSDSLFDGKISPKDLLTISVQTQNPELAAPFNGFYWSPDQQYSRISQQQRTYLVDNKGQVDLPILGKVKFVGLTLSQAERRLKRELSKYFKEIPSVNIKQTNYRYAVIGAVNRPGTFVSENGKVNIFEALANAGDMSIYGDRNMVKIIREQDNGDKKIAILNLKNTDVVNSPYFYLKQGDIIYVQQNSALAKSSNVSSGVTIWFSVASLGLSVTTLLATLLRR